MGRRPRNHGKNLKTNPKKKPKKVKRRPRNHSKKKKKKKEKRRPRNLSKKKKPKKEKRKTIESRTRSVFNPEVAGLSSGETVASEMTNKMMTLFSAIDKSGDGVLQIGNITLSNGSKLDYETLMAMARIIDVTGNGDINYLEFLKAFSVDEGGQADITETLGEDITTTLFRHRHAIRM